MQPRDDHWPIERRVSHFPRTAIIDLTPVGGPSATGQLKANLFRGWPNESLQELSGSTTITCFQHTLGRQPVTVDAAVASVLQFNPDVILYRPVPEAPKLHAVAMALLRMKSIPFVAWIVDDWPRTHWRKATQVFGWQLRDLRDVFNSSHANLAISNEMAAEMDHRYGITFEVVHNGVPRHVLELSSNTQAAASRGSNVDNRPFLLGYRGAVTRRKESLTLDRVAKVVAMTRTSPGWPVQMEIATPSIFMSEFEALSNRSTVSSGAFIDDYSVYLRTLRNYDAVLLAYNFTRTSRKYLSLSLPNKLPELLASGRPILYVGPEGLPAARLLAATDSAVMVTSPRLSAIVRGISGLVNDADRRATVVDSALRISRERFVLENQQRKFWTILSEAGTL
jgi:glycosyltransferase involved in cell wall biosynthesis